MRWWKIFLLKPVFSFLFSPLSFFAAETKGPTFNLSSSTTLLSTSIASSCCCVTVSSVHQLYHSSLLL